MQVRLILPVIAWMSAMLLVIGAPVNEFAKPFIWGISSRSILHGFLFTGFSLSLMSAFHKQHKYKQLKRNVLPITIGIGIFVSVFSEITAIGLHHHNSLNFWNVSMNILGTVFGIVVFKFVYKECC